MEEKTKINKVHDNVEYILSRSLAARKSDKVLIVLYLESFHNITTLKETYMMKCPSFESITRCRRKIQAAGNYQSNKQIKKAREIGA